MDKTIYEQSKVMGFDPKVINLVHYNFFNSSCLMLKLPIEVSKKGT